MFPHPSLTKHFLLAAKTLLEREKASSLRSPVQDVLDKVEIWDLKHAQFIVQSLSQMFGDLEDFDDWAFDGDISNELLFENMCYYLF